MRCKNCLTEIDGAVCPNCGTPAPELSEIEQNEIDEMEEAFWRSIREAEAPEEISEPEGETLPVKPEPEEGKESAEAAEPEETEPEIKAPPQEEERGEDKLWEAVELDEPGPLTETPFKEEKNTEPESIEPETDFPAAEASGGESDEEQGTDMPSDMAWIQERRAKREEWIRQRRLQNRRYLLAGLLALAAVIILLLSVIWSGIGGKTEAVTQAAYVGSDGKLYLAASNRTKPEQIAGQVETLIGYNAAADIYLYLNRSGELIYQKGEELFCIGSGIPQYDIYTDEALQTVVYVLYDKAAMTYDAYVWTQAMEAPLQIEYSVPYVEHFRFRGDGKYVVYNMQNMTGSHMVKLLDVEKAQAGASGANTVFLAGNSYLACYALGMDGTVLYYDYERGGMYLSDGVQTRQVTGALTDVLLLEEDGMLCYMQSNGQVYIKAYGDENAEARQLVCGETSGFEDIELIYDASGNPAMLVLKRDVWYYGIPYTRLQALAEQREADVDYLQMTAEEPFLLQSDGASLFYLANGSLKAVGMPDSGVPEAVTLAEEIDTYGLTSDGRAFWLTDGTLYAAGIESSTSVEIMDGVDEFQIAATHIYIYTSAGELLLLRSTKQDTPVVLDENAGAGTKIMTGVQ